MVDFDKAVALLEAQAKLDVFAKAFKSNHVLKHAYDRKGNTLLHLATAQGCLEIVKFLLEQHASVSASNQEGQTALHLAALTTDSRLSAALLVEIESMPSKARAAVLDAKDAELGRTALHYAAKLGSEHTVQQLIQAGADANVLTKTKHTALRSAAAQGHSAAVTALIAGRARVNIPDVKGVNPLHAAASIGNMEVVAALLNGRDSKAAATACDVKGCSVLHYAISSGKSVLPGVLCQPRHDMCSVHPCHASWTPGCTHLPQNDIRTHSSTQSDLLFKFLQAVDELPSMLIVSSLPRCICTSNTLYCVSCACFSAFDQTHGQSSALKHLIPRSHTLYKMRICSIFSSHAAAQLN